MHPCVLGLFCNHSMKLNRMHLYFELNRKYVFKNNGERSKLIFILLNLLRLIISMFPSQTYVK